MKQKVLVVLNLRNCRVLDCDRGVRVSPECCGCGENIHGEFYCCGEPVWKPIAICSYCKGTGYEGWEYRREERELPF